MSTTLLTQNHSFPFPSSQTGSKLTWLANDLWGKKKIPTNRTLCLKALRYCLHFCNSWSSTLSSHTLPFFTEIFFVVTSLSLLLYANLLLSSFLLLSLSVDSRSAAAKTWSGCWGAHLQSLFYFLFVCFLSWRHFDTFVLFITQYNAPAAWMFKGDICSAALPAQLLFFNKICSNWPWKGFEAICSALLHHESSVVKRTCCLLGVTAKPAYNSSIIQRSIRTQVVPWECVQSLFTWPGSV